MRSVRHLLLIVAVLGALVIGLMPSASAGTYKGKVVGMNPATAHTKSPGVGNVFANPAVLEFQAACAAGQASKIANNNTGAPGTDHLLVDMGGPQFGTVRANAPAVATIPGIDHPFPDLDLFLFDSNCRFKNTTTACGDCGPISTEIDKLTGLYHDYEGISAGANEQASANGARYAVVHVYDGANTDVTVSW